MTVAGALRQKIFALSFLYSLPFGILLYFNSSFLVSRGLSDQGAAVALSLGYVVSVLITLALPTLLRTFGNRSLFSFGLLLTAALYAGVFSSHSALATAIFLPLALAVSTALYALLDLFLATTTGDADKVGGRRGIFGTLRNGAFIIAQLLAVLALSYTAFWHLYLGAAFVFVVLALLSVYLLKTFKDPPYERTNWKAVWRRLSHSKDFRSAFFVQFVLRMFYAVMIVYVPIYLHDHLQIPYEQLGLVFAFMIVPFLLIEIPIGRLQDRLWGEKEVIVVGLLIAAVAVMLLPFITTTSVVVWAVMLFFTRVGAALLDIGSETYFFKHVHGEDSGEVSAFRILFPLSYIIGPLLGALLLFVLPIQWIFFVLGLFLLVSVFPALSLRDTR